MKKLSILTLSMAVVAMAALASCSQSPETTVAEEETVVMETPEPEAAPNTVVDIAAGSPDHTTLVAAVSAAGLVETLSGDGPFTVFAPTDAAFDALPDGTVEYTFGTTKQGPTDRNFDLPCGSR
jgi:uncharacterized surface protein with fasciclin (FAS1) repeats